MQSLGLLHHRVMKPNLAGSYYYLYVKYFLFLVYNHLNSKNVVFYTCTHPVRASAGHHTHLCVGGKRLRVLQHWQKTSPLVVSRCADR